MPRGEGQVTPPCLCSSSPSPALVRPAPEDLALTKPPAQEVVVPSCSWSLPGLSLDPPRKVRCLLRCPLTLSGKAPEAVRGYTTVYPSSGRAAGRLRSGLGLSRPFHQPQSRLPESRHGLLCAVTYVGDKVSATPPLCQLMLSHCSWPGGALGAGIGGEQ